MEQDIEVKAGLPEPEVPLTQEERDERLKAIAAEINDTFGRFERHKERTLRYAIQMGRRLIEAKAIVGHGRFGKWVEDHCPFDHKTANNYMNLTTNLKFETLSNLALKGTVNAIESYRSQKEWAKRRREVAKERAAARFASDPKRRSRFASFRDRRLFKLNQHKAAQQTRSEQYQAQALPDLTKLWPPPRQDAARIEIEWQLPDDVIQGIYVWLPEDGHLAAYGAVKKTSWKGGMALRYHWLLYTKGNNAEDYGVAIDGGHTDGKTRIEGDTWEEIQAKLAELSQAATGIRRAELMDRDPATVRILENWREQRLRHRCRRFYITAPSSLPTSADG